MQSQVVWLVHDSLEIITRSSFTITPQMTTPLLFKKIWFEDTPLKIIISYTKISINRSAV